IWRLRYSSPMNRRREIASILLAVGSLGMLGAPLAIVSTHPDLSTRSGRHLVGGALAITAIVILEVLICLIPLRRGEGWALWAAATPLLILGIPIFVIDAIYVPAATRAATLIAQAAGDLLAAGILVYLVRLRHLS